MAGPSDTQAEQSKGYEDIYLARQPVFDSDMKVWAHELLYRDRKLSRNAVFTDELEATLKVLGGLPLCVDLSCRGKNVIINFPPQGIKEELYAAYPDGRTIVQITEEAHPDDELIYSIQNLKKRGYRFSADNYEDDQANNILYKSADYITIDFSGKDLEHINALVRQCRKNFPQSSLIAKKIEDYEIYQSARKIGFEFFQGFFFQIPQIHSGKKISLSVTSRLKIFNLLQKKDVEFEEISRALSFDVSIVHRLLVYINSPSIGLRKKVESIEEALVIMGLEPLKKWLQIILLSDVKPKEKPHELVFISAQRAYFLELLAGYHNFENIKNQLFLIGLFSVIDAILDHPRESLLEQLSLGIEIEKALLGKESAFSRWIAILENYEKSKWAELEKNIKPFGFSTKGLYAIYEESCHKAASFFYGT